MPALLLLSLTGCAAVGDKAASQSIIYGAAAVLSLLLLVGGVCMVRNKRFWFIVLFSSVLVVNIGYTLLSVSSCLEVALQANRLSYLGSVFLPLSMFMIILDLTNTAYCRKLPWLLTGLSIAVFLIAASPGILPIYYKAVEFRIVDGVSTLVKTYGPLHPIYLVYLLGYFVAMVAVIVRAQIKKTVAATAHAVVVAIAVFVNIGVWFIEQIASIDFEMLSVSYIISETFLLGVHLVTRETQRLRELIRQAEAIPQAPEHTQMPVVTEAIPAERMELFVQGLEQLTPTEKTIFDAHIARLTTQEILAKLDIKESTLKYHNRNLYSKLGVASRKELLELHKHLCTLSKS